MRTYKFSLRARVTSWYLGLLAVALVVFSMGIYVGMRSYLIQSLQRGLSGTTHTIVNEFLSKIGQKNDAWVLDEVDESYVTSPTDRYVRIYTGDHTYYRTVDMHDPLIRLDALPFPGDAPEGTFQRLWVDGHPVMAYLQVYKAADGRVFKVEAGAALVSMQQTLRSLAKILVVASLLILLAAGIGGMLLMARPLRPLVVLTEKAENIGRKELGERLPVIPTGDELERLTHALNGMISRLEESLAHNYRFSADASHELRTPLTIMRGEVEEILQSEMLPSSIAGNLVSTLEEIDRMSRIVNSLMAITRLDDGGERMDVQQLDLTALARTTVEHLRLLAEEKQMTLAFQGDAPVLVLADPMRIRQVVVNLIDNAIKYTPHNKVADGGVQVEVSTIGGNAVLRVVDHGIGIPADSLPQVFDRFYRADFARTRVAGGVGLGLAIVKAIVAAHDGFVTIESQPSFGSIATVTLPLVRETNVSSQRAVSLSRIGRASILDEELVTSKHQ